jgi:SAM-dependent methyltransferase
LLESANDVAELSFSELIGATGEPNTPSGGHATVDAALRLAQPPPFGRVLEIGCATGFTCLEIAACRPDLTVEGVDSNAQAVEAARNAARTAGLTNVRFWVEDARAMRFPDGAFDMVSCGNVPAFVDDRDEIVAECVRVTRPHGVLLAIPIYYREAPPEGLRAEVERSIGATIEVWDEGYWRSLYERHGLALRHGQRHAYRDVPLEEMDAYARTVMASPGNRRYPEDVREELRGALVRHYELFNANNRYAGYSVLVFRKPAVNRDSILFSPE